MSFTCLTVDVAVAVAIVAAGAALFEAWRRRRNRLFQFYLGELFILVTLVAVLLSLLSVEWRECREEQEALRQMQAVSDAKSLTGPHWLRHLVGSRPFAVFDRVDMIHILDRYPISFTVHEMAETGYLQNPEQLSHFRHLRAIDCGNHLAEEILQFVPRPGRLEVLTTYAPEEGLSFLQRVPNLQKLTLVARWTPKPSRHFDAANLALLSRLRYLDLGATDGWGHFEGDDESMSYMENLSCLEVLVVHGSPTDAGTSHLFGLRRLRRLDLSGTSLTDAGLQHLAELERLEELDISGTLVTAVGIEQLQHWKQLKHLDVSGVKASPEVIRRLKQALPDCVVNALELRP